MILINNSKIINKFKVMSLKDFDLLSPKISLYYYGRIRHSAIFGGILTIIMISFCIIYIINIFLETYANASSTFHYYKHFFRDPGIYSFNSTDGIFHYFQIYNPKNNTQVSFNTKYIHLFMSYIKEDYKINPEILSENDHWVYDICREGIDNKNLSKDLFINTTFKNGMCLRYYYNSNIGEYYPVEDYINFIYPNISNFGINNDNHIGTIIEKCNNNSILTKLFGICGDESEIEDYFNKNYGINFNILDSEIIPSKYGKETYNFIYGISNTMKQKKIIETNLIISPLKIDIKQGIFFSSDDKKQSYTLHDNYFIDEGTYKNSHILSIYNFCLSKTGYILKSTNLTVYDSFPKIGGIIQLIYYIFYGINYIYNRFTIVNDTKQLFFTLHSNNEKAKAKVKDFSEMVNEIRQKTQILKNTMKSFKRFSCIEKNDESHFIESKINNIFIKTDFNFNKYTPDSSYHRNYDIDNSKSLSIFPFMSDKDLSIFKSNKSNKYLNISDKKLFTDNSDIISDKLIKKKMNKRLSSELEKSYNFHKNEKKNEKINHIEKNKKPDLTKIRKKPKSIEKNDFHFGFSNNNMMDKEIYHFRNVLQKYFLHKKNSFMYEKLKLDQIDKHYNFIKYFASLICYRVPKNYYSTFRIFREKLISEEHIFRAFNCLYLFEKCFDIQDPQKIDIIELYKNL